MRNLKLLPKLSLRKDKMKSDGQAKGLPWQLDVVAKYNELIKKKKKLTELVVSIRLMRSLRGSINHKTKRNFITAG